MEKQELITMLNRDLADEHAAILRYLVHSYLEGEDTSLGQVCCLAVGKRCGTCTGLG